MSWSADGPPHPELDRRAAPLVLYTDKSPLEGFEDPSRWCENPRSGLAFLGPDGKLHPVRCGCPNKCGFCAYMAVIEDGIVVLEDALEFGPPEVSMTLTTVKPDTEAETFRRDVAHLIQWLRKEVSVEYFSRIEFTTGKGKRSGGHRRIHSHNLLKGIAADVAAQIEPEAVAFWERRTGANRVELAPLRSAAGAMHYVTAHHGKESQRPPKGWVGRRTRYSKGYFARPNDVRREQARELLRDRRAVRASAAQLDEYDIGPEDIGWEYDAWWDHVRDGAAERAMKTKLVRVANLPATWGDDGRPATWETVVVGDA